MKEKPATTTEKTLAGKWVASWRPAREGGKMKEKPARLKMTNRTISEVGPEPNAPYGLGLVYETEPPRRCYAVANSWNMDDEKDVAWICQVYPPWQEEYFFPGKPYTERIYPDGRHVRVGKDGRERLLYDGKAHKPKGAK